MIQKAFIHFFIFILITIQLKSQEGLNKINSKITYEETIRLEGVSKQILFKNALSWIIEVTNLYNQKITLQKNKLSDNTLLNDSSKGILTSTQRFIVERLGSNYLYQYTIDILVDNDRYKYRLTDFKLLSIATFGMQEPLDYQISLDGPEYKPNKKQIYAIKKQIDSEILTLKNSMSKKEISF